MKAVTRVDWLALAFVVLTALDRPPQGLIASALSARRHRRRRVRRRARSRRSSSPADRTRRTRRSPGSRAPRSAPCCSRRVGALAGSARPRRRCRLPPLRVLDSIGGVVLGAAAGLALVWVAGAVCAPHPGPAVAPPRRRSSRSSSSTSTTSVPPRDAAQPARARRPVPGDRRAARAGRAAAIRRSFASRGVRLAAPSVVRVLGTACGLGIEGSGWVAAPKLVVTAAHVVAGRTTRVVVARHRRARCARRSSRSTARTTSRSCGSRGSAAPPAADARSPTPARRWRSSATPRTARSRSMPGRLGSTTVVLEPGRVRPRSGRAQDHGAARRGPARQLRRPGDRRAGRGADDGLRRAHRDVRAASACRATSSRDPRVRAASATGLDRLLRGG